MDWIELVNEGRTEVIRVSDVVAVEFQRGYGDEDATDYEVKVLFGSGRGHQKWIVSVSQAEALRGALVKGATLRLTNTAGPGTDRLDGQGEEWVYGARQDLTAGLEAPMRRKFPPLQT